MLRKDFVEEVEFEQVLPEGQISVTGTQKAWCVRSKGQTKGVLRTGPGGLKSNWIWTGWLGRGICTKSPNPAL